MNNVLSQRRSCKNFGRSPRRLRQAAHLAKCGGRVVLECLIAVQAGEPVEAVLNDFCRLAPELYHATLYHYGALEDEVVA